jgi:gliding motility-associated-like protein
MSNIFRITKQARLIFPTAFTPNQDKLNDSFTVIGQYVDNMTLQIFDRWGTLIYSTTTNEPWDGTQQGRLMPESTYVWKALITDKTGKASTRHGSVALLRK